MTSTLPNNRAIFKPSLNSSRQGSKKAAYDSWLRLLPRELRSFAPFWRGTPVSGDKRCDDGRLYVKSLRGVGGGTVADCSSEVGPLGVNSSHEALSSLTFRKCNAMDQLVTIQLMTSILLVIQLINAHVLHFPLKALASRLTDLEFLPILYSCRAARQWDQPAQ